MPSEKFFVHKEDGSLVRLKGRLVRFLDEEPPTGSDKSAIRTALEVSPDAEGLVQADVGTGPQNLVLHQHLGTLAYADAESVAVGTVAADTASVGNVGDGYSAVADELIVGDEDGSAGMTIVSGSGNTGNLFFADGTSSSAQRSAGKITYNHSADQLQIGTQNTAAVTIDSSQRVGIQDSNPSPSDSLTVSSDNASTSLPLSTMMVRNNSNTTGSCAGIAFQARNSAADVCGAFMGAVSQSTYRTADLAIHTRHNGTYAERLRITNSALVLGSGMAIDFGSVAGGTGTPTPTTGGLLDDYETGTWSGTYVPQTGTFTTMTMSSDLVYTKVGNLVHISGVIGTDNVDITGASNGVKITGLPFANAKVSAISIGFAWNWNTASPLDGYISGSEIWLQTRSSTTARTDGFNVTNMYTGAATGRNVLYFEATYQAS